MKKKLSFLTAAMIMSLSVLTSCSKDDGGKRGPEANLKSVDGTEWIATKAKIKFSRGKYTIDCAIPGWGTYKQNGSHITFDGNSVSIGAGSVTLTEGEISKYGDRMTVSFKDASIWNTGDIEKVNFVYNINAVD